VTIASGPAIPERNTSTLVAAVFFVLRKMKRCW
jgi:hypothetical protein